ncbi:multicopper oxidase family protein [Pseudarthrobacter cellobiosi]|uniref:multicopper oxidase family protein n=1 Tax=Pseudarthrobacter cellobiosi TaxID=2953654 RepID=UPI00208E3084|nr:multicopper oxidase family protein [Pseudarthrobacter sp. HLT1-5]MCO4254517.1 multicopper oxidase family protein [Pseudarthrobacter sp. HLT1-5]
MNPTSSQLDRRQFLALSAAGAAAAALASCTSPRSAAAPARVMPDDPLVAQYEAQRPLAGTTVAQTLKAGPFETNVAGKTFTTWGYNGNLTAPEIRARTGDRLSVALTNGLTEQTSIHWHGLALRNDQDGVQHITQEPIAAGAGLSYDFRLAQPGTYWYHSHMDMQRERALYGALIIEDPAEPLKYDKDWVIILDDWMDGVTGTPDDVLAELSQGMYTAGIDRSASPSPDARPAPSAMKHMLMGSRSDFLGGDAGDVGYPYHLFNSKAPDQAQVLPATAGQVIRLRIINAAGDTAYRVGVPGQKITLTHTDGFPVTHHDVDAVVLGMGERIDALLTVKEGFTPLIGLPEGKTGQALGFISTGTGKQPLPAVLPNKLEGTVLDGSELTADPAVALKERTPDRVHELRLTGSMAKYDWGINGHRFEMVNPFDHAFDIKEGERIEVKFINETDMWHPMHLHGHTFQVGDGGARKDTVIVRPKETVTVIFDADNPGQWLAHCHNAYHAEQGMMSLFSYIK